MLSMRKTGLASPGPYERGETEQARQRIVELQTVIDAIDRALDDEQRRGSI